MPVGYSHWIGLSVLASVGNEREASVNEVEIASNEAEIDVILANYCVNERS